MGCFSRLIALVAAVGAQAAVLQEVAAGEHVHHGHHGHHGHHHHRHHKGNATHAHKVASEDADVEKPAADPVQPASPSAGAAAVAVAVAATSTSAAPDVQIVQKMRALEQELGAKEQAAKAQSALKQGRLEVNAPLPEDFPDRFAAGVSEATGCSPQDVRLLGAVPVAESSGSLDEIVFEAKENVVTSVEDQAADPDSKLANGVLHSFLVQRDLPQQEPSYRDRSVTNAIGGLATTVPPDHVPVSYQLSSVSDASHRTLDIDPAMPYGDLEPFGREDTAQELTESSIHESDAMVDQLERAEVAEEKRAVFRALTRLRGAAITSYDGIARSQTGQLDEYNRNNQWRKVHPLRHLADEESDVKKWAFPGGGDF